MKKPFNNKSNFDPGRLRETISFYKQVSSPDGYGGTALTYVDFQTCRAAELQVRDGGQLEINANASVLNEDRYFVIRYSKNFTPVKQMNVRHGNKHYVINAIIPLDIPIHYIKLLCIRKVSYPTTPGDSNPLFDSNNILRDTGVLVDTQIYNLT